MLNKTEIKLGTKTFEAYEAIGSDGQINFISLIGPRGGETTLVPSRKDATLWAHRISRGKTVWYRRQTDGSFTKIPSDREQVAVAMYRAHLANEGLN